MENEIPEWIMSLYVLVLKHNKPIEDLIVAGENFNPHDKDNKSKYPGVQEYIDNLQDTNE